MAPHVMLNITINFIHLFFSLLNQASLLSDTCNINKHLFPPKYLFPGGRLSSTDMALEGDAGSSFVGNPLIFLDFCKCICKVNQIYNL